MRKLNPLDLLCCGRRVGVKWKLRLGLLVSIVVVVTILSFLPHAAFVVQREVFIPADDGDQQHQIVWGNKQFVLNNDLRGHLPRMRTDLDASNYTSDNSKQKQRGGGDDAAVNLPREGNNNNEWYAGEDEAEQHEEEDGGWRSATDMQEAFSGLNMDNDTIMTYVWQELLKDKTFRSPKNLTMLISAMESLRKNPQAFQHPYVNEFGTNPLKDGKSASGGAEDENYPKIEELTEKEVVLLHTALDKTRRTPFRKLSTRKEEIYHQIQHHKNLSAWQQFHNGITQDALYTKEDEHVIDDVIRDLQNEPIINAVEREGGTQLKLVITFSNGAKALFKPMKFPRERSETWPNHYYFSDFERHFSEIAAYHLDRLLNFRRAPPVAGRYVDVNLLEKLANKGLKKTFFTSPIGNRCFFGTCDYYCDSGHAVCGNPILIEGSLAAYLPGSNNVKRRTVRNPWRRSYSKRRQAEWELNPDYCKSARSKAPFNSGRVFLDLIDLHVLDFLQGNMDRHHIEIFARYGNDTYPINLDNGRGFGKSHHDEMTILAPLIQCCTIRKSTLLTLLHYYEGDTPLSEAMRLSLDQDLVSPVLLDPHLYALDRRLATILRVVSTCVKHSRTPYLSTVVVDDGF